MRSTALVWVPIENLHFGTHDMDWVHVRRWIAQPLNAWPLVEADWTPFGLMVSDGRHRVEAAWDMDVGCLPVIVTQPEGAP